MNQVLVVDDEAAMRAALEANFRRQGWKVTTAGGTSEALERFRLAPCPLVVTDMRMPDGDGLRVMQGVRALAPRDRGDFSDGVRQCAGGRKCHAGRRLRLPDQADLLRAIKGISRARLGLAPGQDSGAEQWGFYWQLGGHAAAARARPASGAHRCGHPDGGGERHRQGTARAAGASLQPAQPAALCGGKLRGVSLTRCWKASCSGTCAAPLPGR